MPVTSSVKVTEDVDESNLEQVCKAVIQFSFCDFGKPINISFSENK